MLPLHTHRLVQVLLQCLAMLCSVLEALTHFCEALLHRFTKSTDLRLQIALHTLHVCQEHLAGNDAVVDHREML